MINYYCTKVLPDTVGGCPLRRAVPSSRKKGGIAMVSYSDLIQFCILIIAIVGLVYKISHKEK
jgi:hypothetical protein